MGVTPWRLYDMTWLKDRSSVIRPGVWLWQVALSVGTRLGLIFLHPITRWVVI